MSDPIAHSWLVNIDGQLRCSCGFTTPMNFTTSTQVQAFALHEKSIKGETPLMSENEPEKPKEDTKEFLKKLSKKLEEDEEMSLLEMDTDTGLQHQRMLLARQLLDLSLQIGILYSEKNWEEFSKVVLDDKKLSGLVGDMILYSRTHDGPEPPDDYICDNCLDDE